MIVELLIVAAVLAAMLWAIHVIASGAIQMLSLRDDADHRDQKLSRHQRHLLNTLMQNPRGVVLTADLFKSVVFLLMIVVVVWLVTRWSESLGWGWIPVLVAALAVTWILRVLVGEVQPRIAAQDSSHLSGAGLAGLAALWWAFGPLLALLRRLGDRRDGSRLAAEKREGIVERALDSLAHSTGTGEPVIEDDEREMIRGVISLETTEVREVMVPRVRIVALEAGASVEDVRKATSEHGHSRFPIFEEDLDSIIGILYVKDLFTTATETDSVDLASMARNAFVVPETKRVDALLEEFKRRKTHIAIVVDEFGGTAGLVTLEDILEEIVGEIQDEHDADEEPILLAPDGSVTAHGVVPLSDIAAKLGLDFSDEKFETVGGLIYDRVGGVPEIGDTVEEHGLIIRIEALDGQRISRVRVTRSHPAPESDH